jgi:hypothetical protein
MPANSSSWIGWWRRASSTIQLHCLGTRASAAAAEPPAGSTNGCSIAYASDTNGQYDASSTGADAFSATAISNPGSAAW